MREKKKKLKKPLLFFVFKFCKKKKTIYISGKEGFMVEKTGKKTSHGNV